MASSTTAQALTAALDDVDFPADKDVLIGAAERNGADPDTVGAIRAVQPASYDNVADVLAAVELSDGDPETREPVNPIEEELGTNRKK